MENLLVDLNTLEAIEHYLPSNADLSGISEFYSVFSDVTRLRMLSALSVSELCVSDLSTILDLNQTTVSHQLKLLRDAKIVSARRNGKIIYYSIMTKIVTINMILQMIEIELIAAESPASPPISSVKAGTAEPIGLNASTISAVRASNSIGKL